MKNLIPENSLELEYIDTSTASLSIPMRGWQLAGLSSVNVREATIVNWMITGTYFTRDLLFKMKKTDSPNCLVCGNGTNESLSHFLIHCPHYDQIREDYLPKIILLNNQISGIVNNNFHLMLSILDPASSKLPEKFLSKIGPQWKVPSSCLENSAPTCMKKERNLSRNMKNTFEYLWFC